MGLWRNREAGFITCRKTDYVERKVKKVWGTKGKKKGEESSAPEYAVARRGEELCQGKRGRRHSRVALAVWQRVTHRTALGPSYSGEGGCGWRLTSP